MHAQGMSQRKIAAHLNCSPSTITYELRRGTPERTGTRGPAPTDKARLGQQRYEENRQRCRKRPAVLKCSAFLSWLKGRIRERKWSFDACVGHARRRGLFPQEPIPCAKTLYNALRAGLLQVSPFDLPLYLKRRRRGGGKPNREHKRVLGRSIETRPEHIGQCSEFGHWEIDTVAGRRAGGGAALPALLEKKTRYLMVLPLTARSAYAVREALLELHGDSAGHFGEVFKSVTSDNGTEFSELSELLESWGTEVYFAHPFSSWERGQNERHNGLVRGFIPKGTALGGYRFDELFLIADEINCLPRRRLGYQTPDELFEAELDNIYKIQPTEHSTANCSI